jgi:replicative DNA helicase
MTEGKDKLAPIYLKSVESEEGLLSCLRGDLLETGAIVTQSGLTSALMLHYAPIFNALMSMWTDGKPFDIITLNGLLRAAGVEYRAEHLSNILYGGQTARHAPRFIESIFEVHAARKLRELGRRLVSDSQDVEKPVADLLSEMRAELESITVAPIARKTRLVDFLMDALAGIESISDESAALDFGIGLDEKAGPFCPSDLIVIAGETGRGKSALAGNIVENVAADGHRVAVFSLEMSGAQNAERMLASQSRVDIRSMKMRKRLQRHSLAPTQQDVNEARRLELAVEAMSKWKVDIIESTFSIHQIAAEMVRLKSTSGLDLTVVDYTQLVEGVRDKGDNREREVASISKVLKRAAVQTNSIVLLLSQLNDDGRLRESRAIGQDANAVLFIEGDPGDMQVRVGKARSAPSGTEIKLRWESQFTRFSAE